MTTAPLTIGVLALQGAFQEHLHLLRLASSSSSLPQDPPTSYHFLEVRNADELAGCDALIIPGGESTTISLVAARSGLLGALREFVKVHRKPTWGTCAGLILLAEEANRTKKGGQELVGGLDVRVNRNFFGRQAESFERRLRLEFLGEGAEEFWGIFIRAPVVEEILVRGSEEVGEDTVVAPVVGGAGEGRERGAVEVMARLPGRSTALVAEGGPLVGLDEEVGDIVAVRQGNVFGTSFHPELTKDARIHIWWLKQVRDVLRRKREALSG